MARFKATFRPSEQVFNAAFSGAVFVSKDDDPDITEIEPPVWTNAKDITVVAPDPEASEDKKSKEITFPPQYGEYAETFDVPKNLTVTDISVYSILFCQYFDCSWEFTQSDVTHPDKDGIEREYRRYTDNRGYAAGERTIRVTWKRKE